MDGWLNNYLLGRLFDNCGLFVTVMHQGIFQVIGQVQVAGFYHVGAGTDCVPGVNAIAGTNSHPDATAGFLHRSAPHFVIWQPDIAKLRIDRQQGMLQIRHWLILLHKR